MYLLRYVSFRFYPVFFFLNAEQRERNNHRFLITSAFKLLLLFKLLRVESLFCSRSLMKPIRIPREESNPLENVSNSLSLLSLSYSVRKSALFPVLLLSFASFESAFEKSYSVQTPLLLLLLFVVLVFVLLLKHTKHLQLVESEKEWIFVSFFALLFFSGKQLLSVVVVFRLCFFYSFASFVLSFVLSSHFFCSREHTHNINNTRPKIMVRSLYT